MTMIQEKREIESEVEIEREGERRRNMKGGRDMASERQI